MRGIISPQFSKIKAEIFMENLSIFWQIFYAVIAVYMFTWVYLYWSMDRIKDFAYDVFGYERGKTFVILCVFFAPITFVLDFLFNIIKAIVEIVYFFKEL